MEQALVFDSYFQDVQEMLGDLCLKLRTVWVIAAASSHLPSQLDRWTVSCTCILLPAAHGAVASRSTAEHKDSLDHLLSLLRSAHADHFVLCADVNMPIFATETKPKGKSELHTGRFREGRAAASGTKTKQKNSHFSHKKRWEK